MNIKYIRQEMAHLNEVVPLEGPRYAACLHTYETASNQRELILKWFADYVIPQLSTSNTSLLSVGCGAGDLDAQILAAGKKHVSRISYVGLEPDPRQCERFVSTMEAADGQDIHIEGHNMRFENFKDKRRFDVVIMVHSLYYMNDPEGAIQSALDMLSETGRLVVLIASNDRLNELSSSFWELENAGSTWFSEDVSRHFESRGIAFERNRIEAKLNITPCCEPESELDSEKGTRIADFVAQVPTGELPLRLRQMIFSYLKATSRRNDGIRWLPHNVDAFTVHSCQARLAEGLDDADTIHTLCG